ncbi:MAG TPA: response regulator [Gemmataceae bacterium]|nr:response regulator [Gemmataceae bacterium]
MPSAKPIVSAAAEVLVPDQPGDAVSTLALSSGSDRLENSSAIVPQSSGIGDAWLAGLLQTTAMPDTAQNPADDSLSQQISLNDDQTILSSLPLDQGNPSNSNQNSPPDDGVGSSSDNTQIGNSPNGGKQASAFGIQQFTGPVADLGDANAIPVTTGTANVFSSSSNLPSDALVSVGVSGAGPSLVSGQGTIATIPDLLAQTDTTPASPTIPTDSSSEFPSTPQGVNRPASGNRSPDTSLVWRVESQPENSYGMGIRWLGASWSGTLRDPHIGETVAYPDVVGLPRSSLSTSGSGVALDRMENATAGIVGMDHGSLNLMHPASVGKDAITETPEVLAGHETRLVGKPASGMNSLPGAVPVSEILADSAGSAATELLRPREVLGLGLKALWSDAVPSPNLDGQGTEHHQELASSASASASALPFRDDGSLSLPVLNAFAGMGMFQVEVAPGGTGTGKATFAANSGTTAVSVANHGSSIWTILTTYALVIVPRQRKYQPTILVVDPDDATRDALSVGLVRAGYYVLPAANVRDAWGMVRTPNARIDLVLMDPNLPDVSGIHLCARLREISPAVPVMVCAGEVEPAEVLQLQQLGVRYYLRKPIAFEELLHTVKAILP